MDSFFQKHLVTDPTTVPGTSTGITADFSHSPILVPKSEPVDELPSQRFSPLRTNPHFLSDEPRRKMPLSLQRKSHITDLILYTGQSSNGSKAYSQRASSSELFMAAGGSQEMQSNGDFGVPETNLGETLQLHEDNRLSTEVLGSLQTNDMQSSELFRASTPDAKSEKDWRNVIRSIRIYYYILLANLLASRETKVQQGRAKRGNYRADRKAAKHMENIGLWQHREKRLVGFIPGVQIGDVFVYRHELCVVGLHSRVQMGIDIVPASKTKLGCPIATSIVFSGGYEDDEDSGDVIIYTGQGGQFNNGRTQIFHKKLKSGNLALERSMHYGIEIRVIRGIHYEGSPTGRVYIYDGLYRIVDTWFDEGRSDGGVYKFKLVRMENQPVTGSSILKFAQSLLRQVLPDRYICVDISKNWENLQVHLFNDVDEDREPALHTYISKAILPAIPNSNPRGCPCDTECSYYCPCSLENGCVYVYDKRGNLVRGKPMIYECGPSCGCPPSCRNRRTHTGLDKTFEVFRTIDKRWGVRCLNLIQPGSFICELAGVGLTMDQARVVTMNGIDNLIYSNQFANSWREWEDVSQVNPEYALPTSPPAPISDFALEVSGLRNLACYIRHSSSAANLFVQRVASDEQSSKYPRLMLFASQIIPPMRELALDYGKGKKRKDPEVLKIEN